MFIGIEGIARKVTGAHIGVDGVARKVKKAYIGVDGVARLAWEAEGGSGGGESSGVRAYLYNDTKAPQLPEWDREKYPNGILLYNSMLSTFQFRAYAENAYYFRGSDGTLYYGCNYPGGGAKVAWCYFNWDVENAAWSDLSTGFTTLRTIPDDVIWSNFDMEYEDTLYMAASDPVPLYNYNGVELPELPVEVKSHPYTVVFQDPTDAAFANYCWAFGFSAKPASWKKTIVSFDYIYHGETTSVAQRAGAYPSEPWTVENDTLPSGGYRELKTVLWANYDVLNPDGTIYLSASEPQPVYF